jgi:hypothetical protein
LPKAVFERVSHPLFCRCNIVFLSADPFSLLLT